MAANRKLLVPLVALAAGIGVVAARGRRGAALPVGGPAADGSPAAPIGTSEAPPGEVKLPPYWFMRLFWFTHRRVHRLTRGRIGLWRPKGDRWGAMCVVAVGRHTGRERRVMVGYFPDGDRFVTMAMNGWQPGTPAWWLNVQAHPDVVVETPDGPHLVTARAAEGEERDRLWARWREIDKDLDAYAARRPQPTPVVVFEPRR